MSPEQVQGKAIDKRADVWALGCVLFERLTGKRAFRGDSVTETITSTLKGEPDWAGMTAAESVTGSVATAARKSGGAAL